LTQYNQFIIYKHNMAEDKGGAPLGNANWRGKVWNDCLRRAIAQDDGKRVRAAAEELLNLAAAGTPWAVKELADRLDGKSVQGVELTGDPDRPLAFTEITRTIIKPK
jgi:hypothetical protein